jgi:DNA-binding MarR family transcriptional regulator
MEDERTRQVQVITQRLRIVFRTIQAHAKTVETECGLSSAKLWMLNEIAAEPGLKVSKLAAALSIHPSTCSNMLSKLEERGLINRDRSKQDQRTVYLFVTEQGKKLLENAPRPRQGKLANALHSLSESQLARLEVGLEDLIKVLQHHDEDAGFLPIPSE